MNYSNTKHKPKSVFTHYSMKKNKIEYLEYSKMYVVLYYVMEHA
jgi:hypothetical protein